MANVFTSKQNGEKVNIIKEDDAFYTLNDGVRIKKETFFKRYEQNDEIDPADFLNPQSALERLSQEIKNMDSSKITDDQQQGTRLKYQEPTVLSDDSRRNPVVDNNVPSESPKISEARKQQMIDEYNIKLELGEQANEPSFMNENTNKEDNSYIEYEMPQPGEGNLRQTHSNPNTPNQKPTQNTVQQKTQPQVIDPLKMMFKMFKNNYDIKLTFDIEEKIANPAFIEMIMENVDGDAIEYYTKKILDKIIKNPAKLEKEIYKQLKVEVYGEPELIKEEKEEKVTEVDTTKVKLYEGRLPMTKKEENEEKEEEEEKVTEVGTNKVKI
jgi:hypothetical protein